MHAVVRRYSGADLADQLAARSDDVRSLISDVPGLVAYYLIRAGDETVSVTVCDDERGTEESNRRAAAWISENAPDLTGASPQVTSGTVTISV